MQTKVETMIEKLRNISPDRLDEIADFIEFIQLKDRDFHLQSEFTKASEEVFSKVWDNEEDSAYDRL